MHGAAAPEHRLQASGLLGSDVTCESHAWLGVVLNCIDMYVMIGVCNCTNVCTMCESIVGCGTKATDPDAAARLLAQDMKAQQIGTEASWCGIALCSDWTRTLGG